MPFSKANQSRPQLVAEITQLYSHYGFDRLPLDAFRNVLVFRHASVYFKNAELLILAEDSDWGPCKDDLERSGFAVTHRVFEGLPGAQERLFKGFFTTKTAKLSLTRDYEAFRERASRSIAVAGATYA